MTDTRPVTYRQMTPDEVLAELRLFCHNWDFTDADVAKYVRPEASLIELARYDPEADWGDLISHHGLSLPDDEWFAKLPPERTVGDLCEVVARLTEVPVIEPVSILGTRCETAGAFLTLKQMLADAGENVDELGPSSELKPYLWVRPEVFQRFRLATGRRLPPFDQMIPWSCFAVLASLLCAGVAWLAKAEVGACALTAVAVPFLLVSVHLRPRFAPTFDGGRVTTFRDLIHAALGRTPRTQAT